MYTDNNNNNNHTHTHTQHTRNEAKKSYRTHRNTVVWFLVVVSITHTHTTHTE